MQQFDDRTTDDKQINCEVRYNLIWYFSVVVVWQELGGCGVVENPVILSVYVGALTSNRLQEVQLVAKKLPRPPPRFLWTTIFKVVVLIVSMRQTIAISFYSPN